MWKKDWMSWLHIQIWDSVLSKLLKRKIRTGSTTGSCLLYTSYLGICTLQQLIGDTVPEVLATMDGLFVHPSFTEDFQNEQKEMVKAFAKKGGQNVEEKDFDQFFASAGEKTSYRKLLRDTMDKPMYLPTKEEFLKYVNEDYHVILSLIHISGLCSTVWCK